MVGFIISRAARSVNDDDMIVDEYYAQQKHLRVGDP